MELASDLSSLQIEENRMVEGTSNLSANPEIMSTDEPEEESPSAASRRTRSSRKRVRAVAVACTARPQWKKRLQNLDTDEKKICLFYTNVNKNWKTKHTNLETIFEEPKESRDGNEMTMSKAKLRRSLIFNTDRVTKAKKERRRKAITKNKSDVIKAKIAKSGV
ncbi:uncharacterized protein LOC117644326 [Thrips palmi]|uniref:Uncharacterized protein LOC117644326 n=1 Tax=Thrips palmi TaxID=161013 RepID=A0A6P8YIE5_THRPL|nr:uncharacterized protein LOC117644326 [Thrips palmi]